VGACASLANSKAAAGVTMASAHGELEPLFQRSQRRARRGSGAGCELAAAGVARAAGNIAVVATVVRTFETISEANAQSTLLQVDARIGAALAQSPAGPAVGNAACAVWNVELGFAAVVAGETRVAVAVPRRAIRFAHSRVATRAAVSGGAHVGALATVQRIVREVEVASARVPAVAKAWVAGGNATLSCHAHGGTAICWAGVAARPTVEDVIVEAGFAAVVRT
jgi:hypothetical protein